MFKKEKRKKKRVKKVKWGKLFIHGTKPLGKIHFYHFPPGICDDMDGFVAAKKEQAQASPGTGLHGRGRPRLG